MRDIHGDHLRILEADQTVYLHPRATRPWGAAIEVGSDALPDVVLEVDNTADVRRGKLALYAGDPLGAERGRAVARHHGGTASSGANAGRRGGHRAG